MHKSRCQPQNNTVLGASLPSCGNIPWLLQGLDLYATQLTAYNYHHLCHLALFWNKCIGLTTAPLGNYQTRCVRETCSACHLTYVDKVKTFSLISMARCKARYEAKSCIGVRIFLLDEEGQSVEPGRRPLRSLSARSQNIAILKKRLDLDLHLPTWD